MTCTLRRRSDSERTYAPANESASIQWKTRTGMSQTLTLTLTLSFMASPLRHADGVFVEVITIGTGVTGGAVCGAAHGGRLERRDRYLVVLVHEPAAAGDARQGSRGRYICRWTAHPEIPCHRTRGRRVERRIRAVVPVESAEHRCPIRGLQEAGRVG